MIGRTILIAALLLPVPATAQEVGPALDPGSMVGWAGGSAVHRANQRRSGDLPSARSSSARAAAVCASLPQYRARYGAGNPKVRRLAELCSMRR